MMTKIFNILLRKLLKSKILYLSLFLISVGCSKGKSEKGAAVQNFSTSKSEHKIELLKLKINTHLQLINDTNEKIGIFKEELYCLQIDIIEKKVINLRSMNFKMKQNKAAYTKFLENHTKGLFLEERKILIDIIENSITFAHKAQVVLDGVLEYITDISEERSL